MKKIKIFLMGGLGNNLFQLAFGEILKEQGYKVSYNTYLQQNNLLTKFLGWSIHPNAAIKKIIGESFLEKKISYMDFLYLLRVFFKSKVGVVDLQATNNNIGKSKRVIGYWQNSNVLPKLLLEKLKQTIDDYQAIHKLKQVKRNVIHVRRGDFKSNDVLDYNYYFKSIKKSQKDKFVIVTNDSSVLQEFSINFPEYDFELSLGKDQFEDFLILAESSLLITSNSTFSYWASQVNADKRLIYPSKLNDDKDWCFTISNSDSFKVDSFY